jgi:hypothetical protein
MKRQRSIITTATAIAVTASVALPGSAMAQAPLGTLSVSKPTCSKTAKASVTVSAKPSASVAGAGVAALTISKKSGLPGAPGPNVIADATYWLSPKPGQMLFVAGKTRSLTASVPAGVVVYGLVGFFTSGGYDPQSHSFMVPKCPKPKKPVFTG